ncbi:MAG: iron ABC transporter permease [Thermodesulfobacteriota bacterium]|nr:iron ABC transporter permease [Thermodesulfobacteriota bacterium]
MEHYRTVFTDMRQLTLLLKTLVLASGVTIFCLIIGVSFAFLLARTDVYGRRIWQWLYLLPLCIPPYLHAVTWICLLKEKGLVNTFLIKWFHLKAPLIDIYGISGSMVVLTFSYFPFIVLLTLSGFHTMDQRMEDAARLNYRPFGVMKKVTLPLISPYIFSGAVFVFIFSLFNYGVPALLRVHTYPVEIFARFSAFYNEGGATAQSFPIAVIALILITFQRYYMGSRSYVTINTESKGASIFYLNRYRAVAGLFIFVIILFSVVLPLVILSMQAGSFKSYQVAFSKSSREIITTVSLSVVAATAMICLAYFLSHPIEDRQVKGHTLLDYLTFAPFAFPATALGIGMIRFWNRPLTEAIYNSSLIVVLAYIARFIPFSIRTLNSNLKQISTSVIEAAVLCEKSWFKRTVKIQLPLSLKGVAAGWVIAFILCTGELGATLLVIPPGNGSISLKIYTLMHYGANKIVAALALIVIGINLLISFTVLSSMRFGWRRQQI